MVAIVAGIFSLLPVIVSPKNPNERVSILIAIIQSVQTASGVASVPTPDFTATPFQTVTPAFTHTSTASATSPVSPTPPVPTATVLNPEQVAGTIVAQTLTALAPTPTSTLPMEQIVETMLARTPTGAPATREIVIVTATAQSTTPSPILTATYTPTATWTLIRIPTLTPFISSIEQINPTITLTSISSTGIGCNCVPSGCGVLLVAQGAAVPSSSILEPPGGSRGNLYQYKVAGQAAVNGVLWTYVDNNGQPASNACVEAQFQFFRYNNLIVIDQNSPFSNR